jgi:membrane associated rhomboid family serine protease
MIVPWLYGLLDLSKAPITWTLIALNSLLFLMTSQPAKVDRGFVWDQKKIEQIAILYWQYQKRDSSLPEKEQVYLLGLQALKSAQFLRDAESFTFKGDPVQIRSLRDDLIAYRDKTGQPNTKLFGIKDFNGGLPQWITYQFMHAGVIHLMSNMLMLLICGAALELIFGSHWLLGIYLLGGIFGALSFLFFGGESTAPMVGASASLSSVMAFYTIIERKARVPFFYFFSPFKGHFGWVHLPTFFILVVGFVGDLAGLFNSHPALANSVAYLAHVGGAAFGLSAALIVRFVFKYRQERIPFAWYFQSRISDP